MTQSSATLLLRAKALNVAGALAMLQTDYEAAKAFLEEGLALYRKLVDEEGIASCLTYLGYTGTLGHRGDIPIVNFLEEALELRPRLGNRRTVAHLLVLSGIVAGALRDDWDEAAALHEEALATFREIRDAQGIGLCLYDLGLIETIRSSPSRAKVLLRELMRLGRGLRSKQDTLHAFFGLAAAAASEGRTVRAVRIWGISEAMQEADNTKIAPVAYASVGYEERLTTARSQLGDASFEEAWAEGKVMTRDEAIKYALIEEPVPISVPEESPTHTLTASLTRREEEVAALVARGLTNRRIAEEISISERTAATHVGRILKKLNLRSREQVATWAAGQRSRAGNQTTR